MLFNTLQFAKFFIVVDKQHSVLHTAGEETAHAIHTVTLPDGPHSLEVRSVDERPVRAFGIRMERETTPGVTLSALGITGARARFLDKSDDAHWAQALKGAKPDLVVLAFGSNEATDGLLYPMDKYEATLLAVMKQVKAALPNASLMLVGPPDMASKVEVSHSRTVLPVLINVQKKLAKQEGWAFWNQYLAMGGAGSMWKWIKLGLGSHDMFHPTGIGGNQLGTWQFHATMQAYNAYKKRQNIK